MSPTCFSATSWPPPPELQSPLRASRWWRNVCPEVVSEPSRAAVSVSSMRPAPLLSWPALLHSGATRFRCWPPRTAQMKRNWENKTMNKNFNVLSNYSIIHSCTQTVVHIISLLYIFAWRGRCDIFDTVCIWKCLSRTFLFVFAHLFWCFHSITASTTYEEGQNIYGS